MLTILTGLVLIVYLLVTSFTHKKQPMSQLLVTATLILCIIICAIVGFKLPRVDHFTTYDLHVVELPKLAFSPYVYIIKNVDVPKPYIDIQFCTNKAGGLWTISYPDPYVILYDKDASPKLIVHKAYVDNVWLQALFITEESSDTWYEFFVPSSEYVYTYTCTSLPVPY